MKPEKFALYLAIIGTALIVVPIGVFGYFFFYQQLSFDIVDWGAFGSYFGGVIGVSISTLALVGAVYAIYQQHKSEEVRDKRMRASSLMDTIDRVDNKLESLLTSLPVNINFKEVGSELKVTAFDILTQIHLPEVLDQAIPKYSEDQKELAKIITKDTTQIDELVFKSRQHWVFSSAAGELRLLRTLILKHKELTDQNVAVIYYLRKYANAVDRLITAGYPIDSWDGIEIINKEAKENGANASE